MQICKYFLMERDSYIMISDIDKPNLRVGYKQTVRALNENQAEKVFVTLDSEDRISESVKELCKKQNVPFEIIDTMRELGSMCGIDVGASCAVVIK